MRNIICIVSVAIAVVITVLYMRLGGIFGNESALSYVGLSHPLFFAVWGISTYFALAYNIYVGYSRTKFRFYIPLIVVSLAGIILTLTCDFDYSKYPQYLAHCIGSLSFSAVMGITVFLLFIIRKKYVLSLLCGIILIADLVLLLIFKETALIEVVPIFAGYILLLIHNLKKEKTEENIKKTQKDNKTEKEKEIIAA